MWLLPIVSPLSRLLLTGFYRFRVAGGTVPRTGPVLLVANHPNSLLDPACVVAVAGRPVRFLAKAPLLSDPLVGWLVRASGSIPVYRRQDDPSLLERNQDTFRAAHAALERGDLIGIFPEGISHNEPSLAPLRTGAARIALGAVGGTGPFPIIPVGLVLRDKQRFRSAASAVIGTPISWDDLATRGEDDVEAVRDLTERIDAGLREVTINLERRQDARAVVAAEAIFNAERGVRLTEVERIQALGEITTALTRLRANHREDWRPLARDVAAHSRRLAALGMRPHQLSRPGGRAALLWTVRQLLVLSLLAVPALIGGLVYLIPYLVTDRITHRFCPAVDIEATYKLLVGTVAHLLWTVLAAVTIGYILGTGAGVAAVVVLPLCGWSTVRAVERVHRTRATARRYIIRERRDELLAELSAAQEQIASRLARLRATVNG